MFDRRILLFAFALLPLSIGAVFAADVVSEEDLEAAKANHEMVENGEAVQAKCPFTGGPMKDSKSVTVDGVEVKFCCGNCLAKAEAASGDAQMVLLFGPKAFKKGFEKKSE